ncbi:MAG: tRNA (adenosine(37)-N6)-dimethylallyltransferase MiaA [bacterium]|nr:tRNA (adenosine(37)-N6)-dimethylallyltransferase MiaA [bacterium]
MTWTSNLDAADQNRLKVICGPTASGKTSAALKLSRHKQIEIVSADSRQIIKQLEIGTAKPTREEREQVAFHLLDLIEPGERYSAFKFIEDASTAIKDILNRGRLPVIVGGTGLYLKALSQGVVEVERGDSRVREKLESELDELGTEQMHRRLSEIDPDEAEKIHPNNKQRLVRALEIYELTGKSKSEIVASGEYRKAEFEFDFHCLIPPRELLYERINKRVDRMIEAGLVEEFHGLIERGMSDRLRKANVIGYQELLDWRDGKADFEEAVNMIKQNSRRYAKRQITWFRGQTDAQFYPNEQALLDVLLQ